MKHIKIIAFGNLIFPICFLVSAYQNNNQTDLGPLYAPFINNKWKFYAIGDSSGAIAYHYDPTAKYSSNPVYIYFREDKQLAAYTRSGVIGDYNIIDTGIIRFKIENNKNLLD